MGIEPQRAVFSSCARRSDPTLAMPSLWAWRGLDSPSKLSKKQKMYCNCSTLSVFGDPYGRSKSRASAGASCAVKKGNGKLACNLQVSHIETDNQNTPKAINDFRGILVSHYLDMSNTETREFRYAKIRSLSALQASLQISERRNRTHACYARRAAPDE